jgi:hypothetical protein
MHPVSEAIQSLGSTAAATYGSLADLAPIPPDLWRFTP